MTSPRALLQRIDQELTRRAAATTLEAELEALLSEITDTLAETPDDPRAALTEGIERLRTLREQVASLLT